MFLDVRRTTFFCSSYVGDEERILHSSHAHDIGGPSATRLLRHPLRPCVLYQAVPPQPPSDLRSLSRAYQGARPARRERWQSTRTHSLYVVLGSSTIVGRQKRQERETPPRVSVPLHYIEQYLRSIVSLHRIRLLSVGRPATERGVEKAD